jgi:hypothetical protein
MKFQNEELSMLLENQFNASIANSYSKEDRQVKLMIDSTMFNKIVSCLEKKN